MADAETSTLTPCRKCTGRGFHYLTCPRLKLAPGWRFRSAEPRKESDEWPDLLSTET
jgi:hypothetical protein